jgi:hypothetical protein
MRWCTARCAALCSIHPPASPDFGPAQGQGVEVSSVHVDLTPFDYRSITADMWVLP